MIGPNIACGKRVIVIRCGSVAIVYVRVLIIELNDG
jgi:ribosomal protein L13